jgi:molecular chaperone DnaJ
MMSQSDYYALLGVKRTVKISELRRAFRRLARKFHPDINPGDRAAEVHYRRICEAFEILSHAESRERYDRLGEMPQSEPETPPANYGFEGFDFSITATSDAALFPEIFRRQKSKREGGERRGEDLQHSLRMSFEESLKGVTASFQIMRLVSCPDCLGWGEVTSGEQETCEPCGGSGRATQRHGHMLFAKPCPECEGGGVLDRQTCPKCQGGGRMAKQETVTITTPAGAFDGYRIVVPGKGHEGRGGGRSGDLHVLIHVAPHPFMTRKGDNLFCTIRVTFTEAALGCRVDVPTMDGTVKVRVPAGVQSGQKLRLSGRGARNIGGGEGRGDLFVIVQVVTPTIHDHRSREILRELAELHPEDPREDS